MREYQVRRTAACPSGEHVRVSDDPDDPTKQIVTTVDCSCPWLVIRESHPVPHMMVWPTAASVQRLIKEFDEGHFDQEGMPRRSRSQFMSPHVSDLLNLIDAKDTVGAAMRLLATVHADQIRWMADTSTLAIRIPFDRGHRDGQSVNSWLLLTFEPGEPIKVDRSSLPDIPSPNGKLDLSQLAALADGETNVPAWELWRTKLTGTEAAAVLQISDQAQQALLDAGVGWQAAPEPADGWHGTAVEVHHTENGPVVVTTVGGEVVGVVGHAAPIDLAQVDTTAVPDNPYTELFAEEGIVHGIRPHRYPRDEAEAEQMRAVQLGRPNLPLIDAGLLDVGPDNAAHVPPQEGDEHD